MEYPNGSAHTHMIDPNNIASYLAGVRQNTQWHENKNVLAPGDRTEYMSKVVEAAMAQLGVGLPGVKIVEALAAQPSVDTVAISLTTIEREWVALYQDRVFTIEGETDWPEVEDNLRTGISLNGRPNDDVIVFTREPKTPPALEVILSSNDPVRSKVLDIARKAWSKEIAAPSLEESTASPGARPNSSRRI